MHAQQHELEETAQTNANINAAQLSQGDQSARTLAALRVDESKNITVHSQQHAHTPAAGRPIYFGRHKIVRLASVTCCGIYSFVLLFLLR